MDEHRVAVGGQLHIGLDKRRSAHDGRLKRRHGVLGSARAVTAMRRDERRFAGGSQRPHEVRRVGARRPGREHEHGDRGDGDEGGGAEVRQVPVGTLGPRRRRHASPSGCGMPATPRVPPTIARSLPFRYRLVTVS